MIQGPEVKGNPLRIAVALLVISFLFGEFVLPKYHLIYAFKIIGVLGLIGSVAIFFSSFSLFKNYKEDPTPSSDTKRLIKTGIFAYTRNPIYLSFVAFHLSMFLIFENVMYFLSSIGLSIWLHNYVIKAEEKFLLNNFPEEFERYMKTVKRWIFF